jgi:hypothetical protein
MARRRGRPVPDAEVDARPARRGPRSLAQLPQSATNTGAVCLVARRLAERRLRLEPDIRLRQQAEPPGIAARARVTATVRCAVSSSVER